jgi:type IV pilus assembly protein PilB
MATNLTPQVPGERKLLGQILVDMGFINVAQLDASLKVCAEKKQRLGDYLVQLKLISEIDLARGLASQYEVAFRDLAKFKPSLASIALLPEKVVRRFLILPLEMSGESLMVAVHNPIDADMLNLVGRILKTPVILNISSRQQLIDAIDRCYQKKDTTEHIIKHLNDENERLAQVNRQDLAQTSRQPSVEHSNDGEVSVESLVNRFLQQGINEKASDIHLDPTEGQCRVRMRLDGILHEMHSYPIGLHPQIISRIKVLAGLDIAEKRNAQDGRFQYRTLSHEADIRISTLPTIRGEKAVLRLLNKRRQNMTLNEIGMNAAMAEEIALLTDRPYGIVLLTGPTGSGKTTTLYAMLNLMNGVERNIITVEDPVEITFDVINQVQVNEKAGVTFPGILRNILRQDPDVIMIGEIRDTETADIAIRAALTGHLVLSTLHTNDALGAIARLIDMKIEPFFVSSALLSVVGQRLVRLLCPGCKKPGPISERDRLALGENLVATGAIVHSPGGCETCHQSGYKGRVPLFEMMKVDHTIKKAINDQTSDVEILGYMRKKGFKTMRENGIESVLAGLTSVDEVLKATS